MHTWDHLLTKNDEYTIELAKARLKVAIDSVLHENSECLGKLAVCVAPHANRCVIATAPLKIGAMVLAPVASAFDVTNSLVAKDKNVPDSAMSTTNELVLSTGRRGTLYIVPKGIVKASPEGAAKTTHEFIAPLWCVTLTGDSDAANAAITIIKVPVCGVEVSVPVVRNTRALKKGDHVMIRQRHGEKSKWPISHGEEEPPSKRAKSQTTTKA